MLFERRMRPNLGSLSPLRHEVDHSLAPVVSADTRRDIILLISELCTNAIEASKRRCEIEVRVGTPTKGVLVVEVEDCGEGFVISDRVALDSEEAGRGLHIVKALADDVVIDRHGKRTRVRALLRRDEALQLAGDLQ